MDPNLFRVDWEQLLEVLIAIVVLAFIVERALSIVFEHRYFVPRFGKAGVKEPIAFAVAYFICWRWNFDVLSVLLRAEEMSIIGYAITAAVIAGGSKASIKLFHDVIGARNETVAAKVGGEKK
jgi:hypothetical protein